MANKEYCLVYTTTPDEREAHKIAENVMIKKLAACANIGKGITSIYWWEGALQSAEETPVIFKTTKEKYAELEQLIKKSHSYENPCIIMLDITGGSKEFLNWIDESIKK